jgi:hypothetical protein
VRPLTLFTSAENQFDRKTKCSLVIDVRPAERENARVLACVPRAAELYREQIDLGLSGDPAVAAEARNGNEASIRN